MLTFGQKFFVGLSVGTDSKRTDTPGNEPALVETVTGESDTMLGGIGARLPCFQEHGKNVPILDVVGFLREGTIFTMHLRDDLQTVAKMSVLKMLLPGFQGVVLHATTKTAHFIKRAILFLDGRTELLFQCSAVLSAGQGDCGKQQREGAFHGSELPPSLTSCFPRHKFLCSLVMTLGAYWCFSLMDLSWS